MLYQVVKVHCILKSPDGSWKRLSTTEMFEALSKKVTALMKEGWKCQGGIALLDNGGTLNEVLQAMVYNALP